MSWWPQQYQFDMYMRHDEQDSIFENIEYDFFRVDLFLFAWADFRELVLQNVGHIFR